MRGKAAAVAELRELAGGRGNPLMAEVAGVFEGAREREHDEPLKRQGKQLRARPEPTRRQSPRVDPGRLALATTAARCPPFSGGLRF